MARGWSCEQLCECEWRLRLCEREQRFFELEYEQRCASRKQVNQLYGVCLRDRQ